MAARPRAAGRSRRDERDGAASARSPTLLRRRGLWFGLAAWTIVFGAHLAYGSLMAQPALLASALAGLLLLGSLTIDRNLRRDVSSVSGLFPLFGLFLCVLAIVGLSLTPHAIGGVHPIWAYVGISPGAGTLDRSTTLLEIVKLMGLASFFGLGLLLGADDERAETAVLIFVAFATVFGLWAFFAFTTGAVYQTQRGRLEGTLLSPNTAGTFFGVALTIALGTLARGLRRTSGRARLEAAAPHWAAVMILGVCLLLTLSRTAAFGALASMAAFGLLLLFSGKASLSRASLVALLSAGALLLALVLFGEPLLERFSRVETDGVARAELYALHWEAFRATPLAGVGLGNFDLLHRMLLDAENLQRLWVNRAAHNVYLQWLVEVGLPGALPMFLLIALVLIATILGALRRTRMVHLICALAAANLVVLIHGATDFALQTPSFAMMWSLLLGLQFSLAQSRRG